jgi:hypothetical protein
MRTYTKTYFKTTGNPCPMLNLHIESYKWVEEVPVKPLNRVNTIELPREVKP